MARPASLRLHPLHSTFPSVRSTCPTLLVGSCLPLIMTIHVSVNMVLNVHRNHKALLRTGRRGWGGVYGGGERGRLDTYRYTVTTRMTSALRWAAMTAILIFRNCGETKSQDSVHRPQLLKKGEPNQIRIEILLLTSLTPHR